jgi:hypothetical protein
MKMLARSFPLLLASGGLAALVALVFSTAPPHSQAQDSKKAIKALLITGGCCHDYSNQKLILTTGIAERTSLPIDWTVIHQGGTTTDTKIPFYENENWADGYDVVIHNECFAKIKDPAWADRVLNPHRAGTPAVLVHCSMHCYRVEVDGEKDPRWFEFCGVTSHRHGPKHAFAVKNLKPDHPVMKDFGDSWTTPEGELYYIEKVWPTATPLAHSKSEDTGKMNVNVWTNAYGEKKTRVFGTTIGHHNSTMMSPEYLDLMTRGFLWAAGQLDDSALKKIDSADSLKGIELQPPPPPRKKKKAK